MQNGIATVEDDLVISYKIKHNSYYMIQQLYDLIFNYPNELKIHVYTKTFTQMFIADLFIADLFIAAKTWQQPRCSLVGEGISKL